MIMANPGFQLVGAHSKSFLFWLEYGRSCEVSRTLGSPTHSIKRLETPMFGRKPMGFEGTYFIFEAAAFHPKKSFTPNSVDGGSFIPNSTGQQKSLNQQKYIPSAVEVSPQ